MNQQLPPIDPDVRAQLARRSAGRLPEGLTTQVLQAVDRAPVKPRYTWRAFSPQPARAIPRTLLAGAGLAAVVLLAAALVVVPRFQTTPASGLAGYPTDRALTTAELAALMAGPALPTNTTLVASVTIESRPDVCPMDSRPTIGLVQGMASQVCVIGSTVSEYLKETTGTGIFAFRYMAPGYLGLIGEVTPAQSRLALHVGDDWPLASDTFLAEGWLGATALPCDATQSFDVGDFLNPAGFEPCQQSWLSEDGSPAPVIENHGAVGPAESDGSAASPAPSIDPLALHGKARYVTAGGMRQIDAIPLETTRGVYVIRKTTGPCPGASPMDSRGCAVWQVLARVAGISLPQATAAPTASLSGYPAGRALTAAELASLMAGPALLTNTALVASVTIDAKTDVCPMNRYPTVGVIEGMGAQVCVMGAGVSAYLSAPKAAGVFAFRYLAPGVLGLIGEITPASSANTAFRVVDDWPLQGKTFLVDGWLGAVGLLVQCALMPTAGDVLVPNGDDCPYDDWLGDEATAPGVQADHGYGPGSPLPSYDPFSLRGNARHVGAGGMRIIDSVDHAAPVRGVYVVRSVVEACAGDPPQSSRGCGAWRVLAKLADVLVPVATPVQPSPTAPAATPPTGYPADRALTTAELAAVMAGPALPVNTTLVAAVAIDAKPYCPADPNQTVGVVEGMASQVCVEGDVLTLPKVTGTFAFRYVSPGVLRNLGQLTLAPSSRLVFRTTEAWPGAITAYYTFLVGGYLVREPTGARIVDTLSGPTPSNYPYLPSQTLQIDSAAGIDLIDPSRYGVFVVTAAWVATSTSTTLPNGNGVSIETDGWAFHLVAEVADISVPGAAGTPPPSPSSSPAAPPATPVALPTGTPGAAPIGLMGSGNRPLTQGEFAALWAADPAHLAGRIVIVKGPVPTGFECSGVGPTGSSATSPRACYANVVDGQIASDGYYWAVRVGADGMLTVVGELSTPGSKFVVSLEEARAVWNTPGSDKAFVLMDAWIGGMAADACDVVGQPCYEVSWLASSPYEVSWVASSPANGQVNVQLGAYHMFGGGSVGGGPALQGIFLIQGLADEGQVLARMKVAVP